MDFLSHDYDFPVSHINFFIGSFTISVPGTNCHHFVETTFFQRKFGLQLNQPGPVDKNDQLHMIAYL
jgi:hypothetical protein